MDDQRTELVLRLILVNHINEPYLEGLVFAIKDCLLKDKVLPELESITVKSWKQLKPKKKVV